MNLKQITAGLKTQRDNEIHYQYTVLKLRQKVIAAHHGLSESRVKKIIQAVKGKK